MIRALLIEDDPLVARMYQKNFDASGFDVDVEMDGEKGLERAVEIKPQVILLDVMLPGMSGLEVLQKLKASAELKAIPVVMLTNLSRAHVAEAKQKGAADYIVKAEVRPAEVVARVKELVGLRSKPAPVRKVGAAVGTKKTAVVS